MLTINSITSRQDLLNPIKQWLQGIPINNVYLAKFLCCIIPNHCPFEQEIKIFNRTLLRIPPLCKLNPFYEELVAIRFRSLSYLTNEYHDNLEHS